MKPRFLADENIDRDLVLGLGRRVDGIDIVRVQDVGLRTASDPEILQWAADQGRILVSHDLRTIPGFVGERLAVVAEASDAEEWTDQIAFLPL